MTVDMYALCPCGSAKKIKFCKCHDSIHDMERIMTMINGGQLVAALDRLNQVLDTHPAAAWALAVKGRLLLDLREYDSLAENAERFIRLQPANPLALTQRAAAQVFKGDLSAATESLLQALTESGEQVDSFVLDVASVLSLALAQNGVVLTSRVYATLAISARGYEAGNTAERVIDELNGSPNLNQLLKTLPSLRERPADAPWGERFDEAAGLLQSNQILLAESKFQSLVRTAPQEPAVLSGALLCAIWRGDAQAQADLLEKLSACESLDFEERARLLAMSALIEPEQPRISVEMLQLTYEIAQADEVDVALTAASRFIPMPPEFLRNAAEQSQQVPPRNGFQLLDRDPPSGDELPAAEAMPEAIATTLLFGKQTDRPARLELLEVRGSDREAVQGQLTAVLGEQSPSNVETSPLPFLGAIHPTVPMLRFKGSQDAANQLQSDLLRLRLPDRVLQTQLPLIDQKTLAEAATDESLKLPRTAIMRMLEQYDSLASAAGDALETVRERLQIEALPAITVEGEELDEVPNHALGRVEVEGMSVEAVVFLLQRARQIGCTSAMKRAAEKLIAEDPQGELQQVKLMAYMTLIQTADEVQQSLSLIEEAKAWAAKANVNAAPVLLAEVGQRLSAGDGEGFRNAMTILTTQHGEDPNVMAQLQRMLVDYGLINPDGTPRSPGSAPPAEAAGGGIWTPGGGGAAAPGPPPADDESSSGGSKLWVPGMD